ncbi:MAG: ISAs1 family transposase [Acidobacteria bacterium]|nr:ISAs1 family transposase [Acidobacteriota bacterium]
MTTLTPIPPALGAAPSGRFAHFADLRDPRKRPHECDHLLFDIISIAILAVICGADEVTALETFGQARQEWLQTFLALPHGIPSHDTFGRVLARLSPRDFERCFRRWVASVAQLTDDEVVALDGKTLRRAHARAQGQGPLALVSAWAQANRLTLGQYQVAGDSNEITAVPELLRLLEVKGCIVTVDALNTQKDTANAIRAQGTEYVLALKANHGLLYEAVRDLCAAVEDNRTANLPYASYQTLDGEHGRIETRRYLSVAAADFLPGFAEWRDLVSVGMVEATREVGGKVSVERRYYLTSLAVDAPRLAHAVRGHWSVENSCHWVLDVVFGEDQCRVRTGHAAANFALLRRLANSLLQQEKTAKVGVANKRFKAALDQRYLLKVLNPPASQ